MRGRSATSTTGASHRSKKNQKREAIFGNIKIEMHPTSTTPTPSIQLGTLLIVNWYEDYPRLRIITPTASKTVLYQVTINNHAENEERENGYFSHSKGYTPNPQLLIINY